MHRHPRPTTTHWTPTLLSLCTFGFSFLLLARASLSASLPSFLASAFLNGLSTGAALNYSLAHVLGRAPEADGFLVTGLLSTFRGFAGSFGAAGGGGLFGRLVRRGLEEGFTGERAWLVSVLVGSPAKVWEAGVLSEAERGVAVGAYREAIGGLFGVVVGVVGVVVVLQAGTGWKPREEEEEGG
ncbi:hypothetical protein QBC39DRAFT_380701 [Podospora conica]|nr:hypothetical protein QBC39DRAFT_380701 [Schizothecium conicum]